MMKIWKIHCAFRENGTNSNVSHGKWKLEKRKIDSHIIQQKNPWNSNVWIVSKITKIKDKARFYVIFGLLQGAFYQSYKHACRVSLEGTTSLYSLSTRQRNAVTTKAHRWWSARVGFCDAVTFMDVALKDKRCKACRQITVSPKCN